MGLSLQTPADLEWLHLVRDKELSVALSEFPGDPQSSVLEIGSGTGYMLERIGARYPNLVGLEIEGSAYDATDPRIVRYDGKKLPFPDSSFDVIFSSHVLEHIPNIEAFIEEMARVLKPGGVAIHILPSSTWRVLTSVFHYAAICRLVVSALTSRGKRVIRNQAKRRSRWELASFLLISPRHGATGNVITEVFYFSRTYWSRVFGRSSLHLRVNRGVGFVYWGRDVLRTVLPEKARVTLSRVLGSSSNLYVLEKGNGAG